MAVKASLRGEVDAARLLREVELMAALRSPYVLQARRECVLMLMHDMMRLSPCNMRACMCPMHASHACVPCVSPMICVHASANQ